MPRALDCDRIARTIELTRFPVPNDDDHTETNTELGSNARLALALLLYTGARRGDVVTFGPHMVRDGWLHFTAQKTGAQVAMPMSSDLLEHIKSLGGHHDRAISAYQRALELNPNDAENVLNDFGQCLSFAGRAKEGVEVVHKAMRLSPHYPDYWIMQLGPIYVDACRYEMLSPH